MIKLRTPRRKAKLTIEQMRTRDALITALNGSVSLLCKLCKSILLFQSAWKIYWRFFLQRRFHHCSAITHWTTYFTFYFLISQLLKTLKFHFVKKKINKLGVLVAHPICTSEEQRNRPSSEQEHYVLFWQNCCGCNTFVIFNAPLS